MVRLDAAAVKSRDEHEQDPTWEAPEYELVRLDQPVRRDVLDRERVGLAEFPAHLGIAELRIARFRLGLEKPSDYMSPPTALVVGENPGPNTSPDMPLFPWPPASSAGRLLAMSELEPGQYLGGLYRRNLVDEIAWVGARAELRARAITTALFDRPSELRVILCGVRVCEAFGGRREFWIPHRLDSRQTAVAIPHPSGLNRLYNDPEARARTRAAVRWAVLGEGEP